MSEHISNRTAPELIQHERLSLHAITEDRVDGVIAMLDGVPGRAEAINTLRAHHLPRRDAVGRRDRWGFGVLVGDDLVGLCALEVTDWKHRGGHVRAWTLEPWRGQGIAPRVMPHLFYLGFELLGLHRIEARCAASKDTWRRAVEKTAGFDLEGTLRGRLRQKDGTYEDERLWAILRPDWEDAYDADEVQVVS